MDGRENAAGGRELPSLGRSIAGLTFLVLLIVGGFVALKKGSESARPESDQIIVRYRRSGGFTGETATLTVRANGHCVATLERGTLNKRREFDLPVETLAEIDGVFDRAGWPEESRTYGEDSVVVSDAYQFDVNYRGVAVRSYVFQPQVRKVVLYLERNVLPQAFAAF